MLKFLFLILLSSENVESRLDTLVEAEKQRTITHEDLWLMPFGSIKNAIRDHAGTVVDEEGNLHLRGGKSSETLYIIDGCPATNPFTGLWSIFLPWESTEAISFIPGNSKYGARSGIVDVTTKLPADNLEGEVTYTTQSLSAPQRTAINIGGPEPILFKLLGAKGLESKFLLGGEICKDTGRVPYSDIYRRVSLAKICLDFKKRYTLRVGFIKNKTDLHSPFFITEYGSSENQWQSYLRWKNVFNHCPDYKSDASLHYLEFNCAFSPITSSRILISHHGTTFWGNVFEDETFDSIRTITLSGDNITIYQHKGSDDFADYDGDGWVEIEGIPTRIHWHDESLPYSYDRSMDIDGYILDGYHPYAWHETRTKNTLIDLKFDSWFMNLHKIEGGVKCNTYDLFRYDVRLFTGGNTGYDRYRIFPYFSTVYLKDIIPLESLTLKAEGACHRFEPNCNVPSDLSSPVPDSLINEGGVIYNPRKAKAKNWINSRFSIAYEFTDRNRIYLNWEYLSQLPPFIFLYYNPHYYLYSPFPFVGNPDLKPEKSNNVEIGLNHSIFKGFDCNLALFYKKMEKIINSEQVYYSLTQYYTRPINDGSGDVYGVEFVLSKPRESGFRYMSGSLNYTYSIAKRKVTYTTSARQWVGLPPITKEFPLDWDAKHVLTLNLNGVIPMGNSKLGIDLSVHYRSGMPWDSLGKMDTLFYRRLPSNYLVHLKLYKSFNFRGIEILPFLQIFNLFDKRDNILFVADSHWYQAFKTKQSKKEAAKGKWNDPIVLEQNRLIEMGIRIKW